MRLLAMMVLAVSFDVPDEVLTLPGFEKALTAVAVERELVDKGHRLCWSSASDRAMAVEYIRWATIDLQDEPGAWAFLPWRERWDSDTVGNQCAANSLQGRWLEDAIILAADSPDRTRLRRILAENELLGFVWRDCSVVIGDAFSLHERRKALGRLRAVLGQKDFLAAEMPPAVPLWRYRPIE